MNNTTTFNRSMFGLSDVNADTVTTKNLIVTGPIKTNLIQSTALGQNLTLESQGNGRVILKANGVNMLQVLNNDPSIGAVIFYTGILWGQLNSGTNNCGVGTSVMRLKPTGSFNTAMGANSLQLLTSGSNNCGFGTTAGTRISSGSNNSCIGTNSGLYITTGTNNMTIGTGAGSGITIGSFNSCIGGGSGILNTIYGTASNNTSIGYGSNNGLLGGIRNTAIGSSCNSVTNTAVFNDATAIGYGAQITSSNQIQLGRASEYVSCQKMSIGKTSVPSNTLDIVGTQEINNGNLIFSKTTPATQVISWTDDLGNAMGLLYASNNSGTFQFSFDPTIITNGFQINTTGITRFQVTDTVINSFLPTQINTGNPLISYNETDTNFTSIYNLGLDQYIDNSSASGKHKFQINGTTKLSIEPTQITASDLFTAKQVSIGNPPPFATNALNVSGTTEITDGNFNFQKTSHATQTIQWYNSTGSLLGRLYVASAAPSSFDAEFNETITTNGFRVTITGGIPKFQVKDAEINCYNLTQLKAGNALRLYNVAETNQTNIYGSLTDNYYNNVSATGTHIFQVNSSSKFTINATNLASTVYISAPTEAIGSSNTRLATTAFVSTAVSNGINALKVTSINDWYSANTFNGIFQTPNVATNDNDVTNYSSVKNEIYSLTTKLEYDDFNELNTTVGFYKWVLNSNAGSTGTIIATSSKAHMGVYQIVTTAAAAYRGIRGASIYSGTPDEIIWVSRTTTTNINWSCKIGISNPTLGAYTNSCVYGHDPVTNRFLAQINNITVYNFTMVSTQNKWYSFKITFNNPNILFTLRNLTDGVTESFNYTAGGWNFGLQLVNLWIIETNVATSTTYQLDYWSMKYTSSRV